MIFLFPTEFEAAPFRESCPDAEVVICGVGMAAAAATMASVVGREPEMVILAGIAGSYDLSKFAINQVVEVTSEQIEELPERFQNSYTTSARFNLPEASSNSVNRSHFIGAKSDIENMEGASVMAICERLGIPFSQIRAISNLVGDGVENWSIKPAIVALTETLITIYRS